MENKDMNTESIWPEHLLYWRRMSSTELSAHVEKTPPEKRLALIVWGVLESHGPFLPVASDSMLAALAADEVAHRLSEERGVQPIIFDGWKDVGSRSATWNFPGAIAFHSSGVPLIREMWEQTLERMFSEGFSKFFLVNGDGGNWMNHWYGLKWDSKRIRELVEECDVELEGQNWDQEGGAPYLHGGSHEHALTTWACRYAPERIRLSAARHGLKAPDESRLHEIDGLDQALLEDVPHRERDWSTYPEQDKRRSVTRFSLKEYKQLLESGDIAKDFEAKVSSLLARVVDMID
jgi:creatinine amidohydrolase/Fe(II)-dependent formamide hydrolase-like protein